MLLTSFSECKGVQRGPVLGRVAIDGGSHMLENRAEGGQGGGASELGGGRGKGEPVCVHAWMDEWAYLATPTLLTSCNGGKVRRRGTHGWR